MHSTTRLPMHSLRALSSSLTTRKEKTAEAGSAVLPQQYGRHALQLHFAHVCALGASSSQVQRLQDLHTLCPCSCSRQNSRKRPHQNWHHTARLIVAYHPHCTPPPTAQRWAGHGEARGTHHIDTTREEHEADCGKKRLRVWKTLKKQNMVFDVRNTKKRKRGSRWEFPPSQLPFCVCSSCKYQVCAQLILRPRCC